MRRRRTIYFNDARHYYLFVFEPPMTLEEAWRPIDEAAGIAVGHLRLRRGKGRRPLLPLQGGHAVQIRGR